MHVDTFTALVQNELDAAAAVFSGRVVIQRGGLAEADLLDCLARASAR